MQTSVRATAAGTPLLLGYSLGNHLLRRLWSYSRSARTGQALGNLGFRRKLDLIAGNLAFVYGSYLVPKHLTDEHKRNLITADIPPRRFPGVVLSGF